MHVIIIFDCLVTKQGHKYHKLRIAFLRFYHRHSGLIVKYSAGLKTLLQQDISEIVFYGDLFYKFERIVRKPSFPGQFKKIIKHYKTLDITWLLYD